MIKAKIGRIRRVWRLLENSTQKIEETVAEYETAGKYEENGRRSYKL